MSVYLLDINVLLALSDPQHLHHVAAHRWFTPKRRANWATCAITENGFVRIASNPNYPNRPGDAPTVLKQLQSFCSMAGHQFWANDISIRTMFQENAAFTHTQLTDLYLLGLAVANRGMLATFDRRIVVSTIPGGNNALEVISAP